MLTAASRAPADNGLNFTVIVQLLLGGATSTVVGLTKIEKGGPTKRDVEGKFHVSTVL